MSKFEIEYIRHILQECNFVVGATMGMDEVSFSKDEVMQRAVVRSLEIIGEASKKVSDEYKFKYPEIDWKGMVGMRDKLIHHYFGVDYATVWDAIKTEIPKLKKEIEKIVVNG